MPPVAAVGVIAVICLPSTKLSLSEIVWLPKSGAESAATLIRIVISSESFSAPVVAELPSASCAR